jgi:hypothetical protein
METYDFIPYIIESGIKIACPYYAPVSGKTPYESLQLSQLTEDGFKPTSVKENLVQYTLHSRLFNTNAKNLWEGYKGSCDSLVVDSSKKRVKLNLNSQSISNGSIGDVFYDTLPDSQGSLQLEYSFNILKKINNSRKILENPFLIALFRNDIGALENFLKINYSTPNILFDFEPILNSSSNTEFVLYSRVDFSPLLHAFPRDSGFNKSFVGVRKDLEQCLFYDQKTINEILQRKILRIQELQSELLLEK